METSMIKEENSEEKLQFVTQIAMLTGHEVHALESLEELL